MWKERIDSFPGKYTFAEPATKEEIGELEKSLNVKLSQELKSFLCESNGVFDEYDYPLVWPVQQIIRENTELRTFEYFKDLYMPFDSLLFIANAGNGDLFGQAVLNGAIQREYIYVWDHEDDSRTWVASSLKDFMKGWAGGTISI
ncbi:SMI1/KNR4 family protein [Pseudobacillus wudalianchiensis]|uniref:Cell wall assembly protein n=1 Tax=Pseudobacillus wudalianchiensis TaxID=1743143 RepID=A0A1B9AMD7_9BACI|nr:SMI1/KNR4 family protein [Bacillus wudalianchiensis]OCA85074.1 cell wall assembly protein [Bacillus wudalianchiensis]